MNCTILVQNKEYNNNNNNIYWYTGISKTTNRR